MKISFLGSTSALLALCGCSAAPKASVAPPRQTPVAKRASKPIAVVKSAPTPTPKIVFSGRSSLPTLPQMMADAPRPTFVPPPTPTPLPVAARTPTPAPRESPVIIVSNAPVAGTDITPQAAAERGLVWTVTKTRLYYRPGSQFYGGGGEGVYMGESQAQARGFRAAQR